MFGHDMPLYVLVVTLYIQKSEGVCLPRSVQNLSQIVHFGVTGKKRGEKESAGKNLNHYVTKSQDL